MKIISQYFVFKEITRLEYPFLMCLILMLFSVFLLILNVATWVETQMPVVPWTDGVSG